MRSLSAFPAVAFTARAVVGGCAQLASAKITATKTTTTKTV
jgi:hypothetical protein